MKILILNWRDIKNPSSGGAEILTHEMAKKWVEWGNEVTQISAKFKNSKKQEIVEGVKIIRMGRWWSVHILAFIYYIKNLRKNTDVIIDEVHGIPFFSAVYSPKKTVLLACEVADRLFFEVFPHPIAQIGLKLERFYFKIYRKIPVLAISASTRDDLAVRGFPKKNITVLPMGFTLPKGIRKFKKENKPTLIYLSRLNKRKGIEDAIEAFKSISENIPSAKLWVVGSGEVSYVEKLKRRIKEYGLTSLVTFFGFVNNKKKFELLSRAHILIFPSIHEGWGLVIAEAGAVGTPTVVYKSAGVKDVVDSGKRGIISPKNNPETLAESIEKVLKNDKLYKSLLNKIKSFERESTWDKTAKTAFLVIRKHELQNNT